MHYHYLFCKHYHVLTQRYWTINTSPLRISVSIARNLTDFSIFDHLLLLLLPFNLLELTSNSAGILSCLLLSYNCCFAPTLTSLCGCAKPPCTGLHYALSTGSPLLTRLVWVCSL